MDCSISKRKSSSVKQRKRISIDLHDYLLPDALVVFVERYNSALMTIQGLEAIEVIHGYGSSGVGGRIRQELRGFLRRQTAKCEIIEGDELGNPGVTILYPKTVLVTDPSWRVPDRLVSRSPAGGSLVGLGVRTKSKSSISDVALLQQSILQVCCSRPRTRDKVELKLKTQFPLRSIRTTINGMLQSGMLRHAGDGTLMEANRKSDKT
jgi:hypothetical protein